MGKQDEQNSLLKAEIDQLRAKISELEKETNNPESHAISELSDKLMHLEWMLSSELPDKETFVPEYGDLSKLNKTGLIINSVDKEQLREITMDYLDLLDTSAAIYEQNGDYALGIFSSGWCKLMDGASRKLCRTKDNCEALASGEWLCHESCWTEASLPSMMENKPVEIKCNGGLNIYAVPIHALGKTVGSINFGFGNPPESEEELKELAAKYKIPFNELKVQANAYRSRPQYIIELAKNRLKRSASRIGQLIEARQIHSELHASEDKMRSIFRVAPTGIGVVVNRIITEVNPRICEMTGYSANELIGNNSIMLYPTQEEYEMVGREKYRQISDTGTGVVETRWKKKDGSLIYVLLASTPIDVTDHSKGVTFTALDITGNKLMHIALQESEENYKGLFTSIRDSIAVTDTSRIITQCNPAFTDLFGYTIEDIRGNSTSILYANPDEHKLMGEKIRENMNIPNFILTINYRKKDGTTFPGETSIYYLKDSEGNTVGYIRMIRDITERKIAEESLRESEERWQFAIEGAGDGLWDWNIKSGEVYFSNQLKAMLGYSPEEIQNDFSEWKKRVHPDDIEQTRKDINAHITGEASIYLNEYRMKCKDGSYKWILDRGKIISKDENGEPLRMIGSHTDTTKRKEAELELVKLKENLEQQVAEKTKELQERITELERFHLATIDREFRIKELRDELESLKKQLSK